MRLLRVDRADVIFHGSFILQAVAAHEGYMVLPSHKEKMDPIKIISYGHKEDGSISKVIALQHEDLSSNSQNQQKSQSCGTCLWSQCHKMGGKDKKAPEDLLAC